MVFFNVNIDQESSMAAKYSSKLQWNVGKIILTSFKLDFSP